MTEGWLGYLLLQLFSFGSKAQEKRGWPGCLGLPVCFASTVVFTVVVVGLAVTLLVVGAKVVVVVGRRVVVALLVVVLLGADVVFCRFTALGLLVFMVFTGAGAPFGRIEVVEFEGAAHKPGKSLEHEVPEGHSEQARPALYISPRMKLPPGP